ncbi:MAG TPA: helix-turn-helix domain-containing protein, partial [Polyangiaceae bacterium]
MSKARNGKVIRPARLTARELARLSTLLREARALRDVATWRRAKAVLGYAQGRSAITMATQLCVDRSAVTKWVGWYAAHGTDALRTRQIPGRA